MSKKIVPIVSFSKTGMAVENGRAVSGLPPVLVTIWLKVRSGYRRWREIRRSRRALCRLTQDQLRDIGLSRGEASREYRRSFYID